MAITAFATQLNMWFLTFACHAWIWKVNLVWAQLPRIKHWDIFWLTSMPEELEMVHLNCILMARSWSKLLSMWTMQKQFQLLQVTLMTVNACIKRRNCIWFAEETARTSQVAHSSDFWVSIRNRALEGALGASWTGKAGWRSKEIFEQAQTRYIASKGPLILKTIVLHLLKTKSTDTWNLLIFIMLWLYCDMVLPNCTLTWWNKLMSFLRCSKSSLFIHCSGVVLKVARENISCISVYTLDTLQEVVAENVKTQLYIHALLQLPKKGFSVTS